MERCGQQDVGHQVNQIKSVFGVPGKPSWLLAMCTVWPGAVGCPAPDSSQPGMKTHQDEHGTQLEISLG